MTEHIIVADDGQIRSLRINRPEKKNALTADMYSALAAALDDANRNPALRCTVIGGVPGAFTAGNDIEEFRRAATDSGGLPRPSQIFLLALARNAKPLIAAVQGVAIGIGTTMLLHCDHVVAGSDARLATPFARLGILPEAGSSLIAPRLMGHSRAFALLVMGRSLDAAEAKACGLVNTIVPPSDVDAEAAKVAAEIAALPPESVAIARRLMRGSVEEIVARIDEEARHFRERLASPEARAAFEAFLSRKR
jgi:enoyl-CoA hydratase/carnithine racemase